MKINVGDYVRTKEGYISKVENLVDDYIWFDNTIYKTYSDSFNTLSEENIKEYIIKISSKIIDLIEVGDYVNGWRVNRIEKKEGGIFFTIGNITSFISKNETDPYLTRDHNDKNKICKMESIVTKEQIESMKYVVKED